MTFIAQYLRSREERKEKQIDIQCSIPLHEMLAHEGGYSVKDNKQDTATNTKPV